MEKEGDPNIRKIVSNNIYGGKIDNKFDLKILDSLVHKFMNEKFFTDPTSLDLVQGKIKGFSANSYQEYLEWAKKIDLIESPIWAGLPISAEDVLKKNNLKALMINL